VRAATGAHRINVPALAFAEGRISDVLPGESVAFGKEVLESGVD